MTAFIAPYLLIIMLYPGLKEGNSVSGSYFATLQACQNAAAYVTEGAAQKFGLKKSVLAMCVPTGAGQ